jgi:gamma-glutamylcyclotransferase (GGCT)/AIG2-like uncharacterized protein YtfP
MEPSIYVFVYGTLRYKGKNHHLIKGPCVAEQAWIYGEMFDIGDVYPVVLSSTTKKMYGELYRVSKDELKQLDSLEGYTEANSDDLFTRVSTTVFTDKGKFRAYTYLYNQKVDKDKQVITSGDWKLDQFLKANPIRVYYFAYGSCMDCERFRVANVESFFNRVIGAAVLVGYSMTYGFIAADGGRADIVECGGKTEGILYEIPFEAIDYLFHREGVDEGWYRPTFVRVQVGEQFYEEVLTFHVYEKQQELAPPAHYANEILRGAKGRVSENYYRELINRLHTLGKMDGIEI